MRAVVTGGTGFLGANLIAELVRQGLHVRATYREAATTVRLRMFPVEWHKSSLSCTQTLARVCEGADILFHCAALFRSASASGLVETNVDGVGNVLDAARSAGVKRIVHCSSVATIARASDGRLSTEDNPCVTELSDTAYARTKQSAERLVTEACGRGTDAVIVNPTHMLGPFARRHGSAAVVRTIAQGLVPKGIGRITDFVDVRDVARGMILLAQRGQRGQRYILGGRALPAREIIDMIASVAEVPSPTMTSAGMEALAEMEEKGFEYLYSSDKARSLGYETGPLLPAIADTLISLRLQHLL